MSKNSGKKLILTTKTSLLEGLPLIFNIRLHEIHGNLVAEVMVHLRVCVLV
jgi:hypothetical protein